VYGEAFLTMQSPASKARIVREIGRLLAPGGRCGLHELAIVPDDIDAASIAAIHRDLSSSIRVGARPLTPSAWRALLEAEGLEIRAQEMAPMRLLEAIQVWRDEGLWRGTRIGLNLLRNPQARRRVAAMRQAFRAHREHLAALCLIAVKKGG
jgi:hypothetical protein